MHYSKLLLALPVLAAALPLNREYSRTPIVSIFCDRVDEKQQSQMPKQARSNEL